MLNNCRNKNKTKYENNPKKTRKAKILNAKLLLKAKNSNHLDKQKTQNNFKVNVATTKRPALQSFNTSNKIRNFKPQSLSKYANKHKTLERKFLVFAKNPEINFNSFKYNNPEIVPYEYKIAFRLKQAINEDYGPKPNTNLQVRQVVVKALRAGILWPTIECLLQECGWQEKISKNCFLLEICFHKKVLLLLSVRTKNVLKFKKLLTQTLKKYQAKYDSILQYFRYDCRIEALAPYSTTKQFVNFERNLAKDAIECQAKAVEIFDYETGAVNLQCHPLQLPAMVEELEKKNFKILYTDYGFEPLAYTRELDINEYKEYKEFLKDLKKFQEVENFYDNVNTISGANKS